MKTGSALPEETLCHQTVLQKTQSGKVGETVEQLAPVTESQGRAVPVHSGGELEDASLVQLHWRKN